MGKKLTPMLAQYNEIKSRYPDAILFYRMGDFYEMFFEDATRAAPLLEVQLTSRDKSADDPIPMCGIPFHAASSYIQKLVDHGVKVAICEQIEDPKKAKGIVKRDVIRVITPALVDDPDLVASENENFLVAMIENKKQEFEICLFDLLSGTIQHGTLPSSILMTDYIVRKAPKELLLPDRPKTSAWLKELISYLPQLLVTHRDSYFESKKSPTLEALKLYLKETHKSESILKIHKPIPLTEVASLRLDATTLSSLEILKGSNGDWRAPNLFQVVNATSTPMGRRLLKDWLSHPLTGMDQIKARHVAVEEWVHHPLTADPLRKSLNAVRDLERLTTKAILELAMPKDLVAIRDIHRLLPEIKTHLKKAKSPLLKEFEKKLSPLNAFTSELEKALLDHPAAHLRDGGIFRDNYTPEIKELRTLAKDAKGTILSIEQRERKRTGIPSLKIRFNKVFGYTIEITKSHLSKVPKDYQRKQTLANGERYVTEEIKNFEAKVVSAEDKLKNLEENLFLQLRRKVTENARPLLTNSKSLAAIDVLLAFAKISRENHYCRPKMHTGFDLSIEAARHAVVESLVPKGEFVPNDILLNSQEGRTLIITGPNMAGKSTIMRQVALISILAQAGCFVPAKRATLPVVEAIYTRIGSSDNLAQGQSTFMVEMAEMSRILSNANERSLILIDEIGRGTSTYDGLALAWSLLEYIHEEIRAKTLFATHFHEITSLENEFSGIKNANVLVEKDRNEIVFLHKLSPGICSKSYGVEVARLAHLPSQVLQRARSILGQLESASQKTQKRRTQSFHPYENQLGLF